MADGAKPDVPTTDRQNEKKKKNAVHFMKRSTRMRVAALKKNAVHFIFLKKNTVHFMKRSTCMRMRVAA